jgi:hypothetical protein
MQDMVPHGCGFYVINLHDLKAKFFLQSLADQREKPLQEFFLDPSQWCPIE